MLNLISAWLQISYAKGPTIILHGSDDGRPTTPDAAFTMGNGEKIVSVIGAAGTYLQSLKFVTNAGRTLGPWGLTTANTFQVNGVATGVFGGVKSSTLAALGVYTSGSARAKYPYFVGGVFANLVGFWDDGANYPGDLLPST
jgi:Jacalin-like lectin domain